MIGKPRLISKYVTSQTGKQIITIPIIPSFSKSKGNQTMKFGQFIEYDIEIFFVKTQTLF